MNTALRVVNMRVVASMESQSRPSSRLGYFTKAEVDAKSRSACWLSRNQQVAIHQRYRQTNGQTDDIQLQDRALHYSASLAKKHSSCGISVFKLSFFDCFSVWQGVY